MSKYKHILILDDDGGPAIQAHGEMPENSPLVLDSNTISVNGLGLTTAGVTDSVNKRFVTDAELQAVQGFIASEQLITSVVGVDLNTAVPSSLTTVPAAKSLVVTKLVIRNASISLTTVSFSVGFNGPATYNDVIADATHVELTGPTLLTILPAKAGAKRGAAADVLKLLCNILQGAAATCDIDVFGYYL